MSEPIYILWRGPAGVEVVDEADEDNNPHHLIHEYTVAFGSRCWSSTWKDANAEDRRAIKEWQE